ncbi:MAG TPA: hypothetical protein VFS07_06850 [Gemmatimonadales bacterium]|nr:hypothetical protein [Gemmatimonadales bacterium]
MPLASFALLVGAPAKWCRNAFAVLGLPARYDHATARRLAVVRLLDQAYGLPLRRAWGVAEELLQGRTPIGEGPVSITLDRARFEADWTARLAALAALPPRGRGRPPRPAAPPRSRAAALRRAESYGLDLSALRAGLRRDPATRLRDLDAAQRLLSQLRR